MEPPAPREGSPEISGKIPGQPSPSPWPLAWSAEEAQAARSRQQHRSEQLLAPLADCRRRGMAHPVYDFLTDYYSFRMAHLRRWSPGAGAVVCESLSGSLDWPALWKHHSPGGLILDLRKISPARRESFRWIASLLRATASRPGHFGCAGLHEWAMVYEQDDIRHSRWPLRLSHAATRRVVESLPITCTHFDAFRFFSASARPLNRFHPTPQNRSALEQPACLHANMDLFKWCLKLAPWLPSEWTLEAFAIAWEARELDMRASPYDLRALGFEPVCIETPEGRRLYEEGQRAIMAKAAPLRSRIAQGIAWLLSLLDQNNAPPPSSPSSRHSHSIVAGGFEEMS